jgi:hypothetical protein
VIKQNGGISQGAFAERIRFETGVQVWGSSFAGAYPPRLGRQGEDTLTCMLSFLGEGLVELVEIGYWAVLPSKHCMLPFLGKISHIISMFVWCSSQSPTQLPNW